MDWLDNAISRQRDNLITMLRKPLSQVADICAENWDNRVHLDHELRQYLKKTNTHRCRMLYAIDQNGAQRSSNITDVDMDDTIVGQDLSDRPYLDLVNEDTDLALSTVYVDQNTHKPCITALHRISLNDQIIGYVAADFGLKDLPLKDVDQTQMQEWRQIKGDPSIRGTLFQQTRTYSAMDEKLDEVLPVIESLMCEQGIFHFKLHFSSSRATLWPYDDPYRYRLHVLDEIIDPRVCLAYPQMDYPADAVTPVDKIPRVLNVFKELREADETIYLRAASLNIMNGIVGLNFSCDGSHYMPVDDFLAKDLDFWFGGASLSCAS